MNDSVRVADYPLWALSWVVWKLIPGRASLKMAGFSHTEAGSGLDMLAAVEETPRPDMRLRYFRHALDELKHSRLFRERAQALATARGRTQAVLDDSGFIHAQGINAQKSLFSTLGELEFLAFVWVHEKRGAEQFDIYASLLRNDPDTAAMFAQIAKDERFHIAYSRAELDRYARAGEEKPVRSAVFRVRSRRAWQLWLRFSRDLGNFVAGLWLGILYWCLLGPFSIIAKLTERPATGIVDAPPRAPARERALEMA